MSSYYENNASWSAPGRQPSWEQQAPPSRSGTASASRDESAAFSSQFEAIAALQSMFLSRPQASGRDRKTDMAYAEIDRATDNLVKSGKWMGGLSGPNRRESMPQMMGRPYGAEYDPRGSGPARHHSISEYDGLRSNSAGGLQGYYANQRFAPQQQAAQQAQQAAQQQQQQAAAAAAQQPPRANEAEQMMQAKRRMAAQRERELRNYHQEQQYNRNITGVTKPDRSSSMSPNTGMSEDERRELIARQHRALYGNESNLYKPDGSAATGQRRQSQDVRVGSSISGASGASARGASPLAFDVFGSQSQSGGAGESAVQMPPRDQPKSPNSGSSPSSNHTSNFGLIDNAQSSRTSVSSPSGSPPLGQGSKQSMATAAGVVPIGTRPAQPAAVSNLNKRATTPLPSPLSYGFNANEQQKTERSASAASNAAENPISGLGASWTSNGSGWGASKNNLGVQASVWG